MLFFRLSCFQLGRALNSSRVISRAACNKQTCVCSRKTRMRFNATVLFWNPNLHEIYIYICELLSNLTESKIFFMPGIFHMIDKLKLNEPSQWIAGKKHRWEEGRCKWDGCVPQSLCRTDRSQGAEGPLLQAAVWWSVPPESTDSYSAWTEHPLPGSPYSSYSESSHTSIHTGTLTWATKLRIILKEMYNDLQSCS